ncbi:MAG: cell division protein SepF [Oscillospiraceae bacterium]
MGFISKIGELFGLGEIDDDVETAEEGSKDFSDYDNSVFVSKENPKRSNKIVNINATTQLEVVLVKPERFDDASGIADHLNNKRTVVLNLESTEKNVSRRLVDFLSGVAYANNGQIKRVANSTFIITPYNVGIVGDLLDELENSGVYF